jgi:hypothetical protein
LLVEIKLHKLRIPISYRYINNVSRGIVAHSAFQKVLIDCANTMFLDCCCRAIFDLDLELMIGSVGAAVRNHVQQRGRSEGHGEKWWQGM